MSYLHFRKLCRQLSNAEEEQVAWKHEEGTVPRVSSGSGLQLRASPHACCHAPMRQPQQPPQGVARLQPPKQADSPAHITNKQSACNLLHDVSRTKDKDVCLDYWWMRFIHLQRKLWHQDRSRQMIAGSAIRRHRHGSMFTETPQLYRQLWEGHAPR